MKLLLDTHALIWFAEADPRLSAAARHAIEDTQNDVFYSAVSIWEMAIKISLGKLKTSNQLDASFRASLSKNGFDFLPIDFEHAAFVASLPRHHGDPFDRLLVAQAILDAMRPVSSDESFDAYPVQRLW